MEDSSLYRNFRESYYEKGGCCGMKRGLQVTKSLTSFPPALDMKSRSELVNELGIAKYDLSQFIV